MLQSLDGAAVRRWVVTCCDVLAAHRDEINALNVFPVPDRDTGSNLLATMRAGLAAVLHRDHCADPEVSPGSTVAVLARGALLGARGNSGIILSQVLRGLAEALIGGDAHMNGDAQSNVARWDGPGLREGLRRADELAMAAVSDPAPGTVLTVLHAAAKAAAAVRSDDMGEVASAATVAAVGALADTPRQLAALATAGVVDAGGRGLILLLEALLAVVTERPGIRPAATTGTTRPLPDPARMGGPAASAGYEYEVMYLLEGADEGKVGSLRAELAALGDCVAVVGSGPPCGGRAAELWNVHVHCSDVSAAIAAGARAGQPQCINVTHFADHITGEPPGEAAHDQFSASHAVLVLVTGSGVADLCRAEGVATAPPTSSVAEILAALAATRARQVTVLAEPAAASTAGIAATQARDAGQTVVALQVVSPVAALAAVAVHDAARQPAEDLAAMTDAATGIRCGELTVARAEALTTAGHCQEGEVLGIIGDEVALIDRDPLTAAGELVARMLSVGGELVTVLLGQDAPNGFGDALIGQLRAAHQDVEILVYVGDVPGRVVLVGVE